MVSRHDVGDASERYISGYVVGLPYIATPLLHPATRGRMHEAPIVTLTVQER